MKKDIILKKQQKNGVSEGNTSRTKKSHLDDNKEVKIFPKESYTDFLIRFLDDSPKKRRKMRNDSSTFLKTDNNNLMKNRLNFDPSKTSYNPDTKRPSISIEQMPKNNNSKRISIKNKNFNSSTNINENENNNENNNIVNIKNINDINNLNNINNSDVNNERKKSIPNINIPLNTLSQFSSEENNINKNFQSLDFNNNINNTIQNTNSNSNINSKLLTKSTLLFNSTINNYSYRNIHSIKDVNRQRLNRLYGYDNNFIKSKRFLLKKKQLLGLENYQDNIIKVAQKNLSKDNMIKLITELKSIKKDAEMVKPLPPINYTALILHSCNEQEKDRRRNKSKTSVNFKKFKDMDEYEKELYTIKKSNVFKRARVARNKNLYKIYEILPEHVVEVLYRNRNKPIF